MNGPVTLRVTGLFLFPGVNGNRYPVSVEVAHLQSKAGIVKAAASALFWTSSSQGASTWATTCSLKALAVDNRAIGSSVAPASMGNMLLLGKCKRRIADHTPLVPSCIARVAQSQQLWFQQVCTRRYQ